MSSARATPKCSRVDRRCARRAGRDRRQQVYVGVSIGIALCPLDADNADELLRRAASRSIAPRTPAATPGVSSRRRPAQNSRCRRRSRTTCARPSTGRIAAQYQPVMDSAGKKMVGVEALVRWPIPVARLHLAAEFHRARGRNANSIQPLGEWVLRARWATSATGRGQGRGQRVGRAIARSEIRSTRSSNCCATDVDAARLELEVTENILLADADAAEEAMISVRAMGVRLALDDFGTGYSSLIYLRRFASTRSRSTSPSWIDGSDRRKRHHRPFHRASLAARSASPSRPKASRRRPAASCRRSPATNCRATCSPKPVAADAITEMPSARTAARTARAPSPDAHYVS